MYSIDTSIGRGNGVLKVLPVKYTDANQGDDREPPRKLLEVTTTRGKGALVLESAVRPLASRLRRWHQRN